MHVSIDVDVRWPGWLRSRRRRVMGAAILALAVVVPGVALASHQFTDVGNGHTFHADIAKLKGAGITAGCGPTTFCPDDPVTRGQMAAFLNRSVGRLAFGSVGGTSNGPATVVGQVSIRAGNPTGGFQYVVVMATVDAYVVGAGCPCEATVGIYRSGGQISPLMYLDLPATPAADNDTDGVATAIALDLVPTGVAQTYQVQLRRDIGTGLVNAFGTVVAMTYPFDGQGGSPQWSPASGAPGPAVVGKPED